MKILIADKLSRKTIEDLKKLGTQVDIKPDLTAEDLPEAVKDYDILVVRSTEVVKKTFENSNHLSLVIRAGVGVNTIDLKTASRMGIYVANCPNKNTDAVTELTMGLLISIDRRIPAATADLKNGVWNKKEYGKAEGIKGRTLGIIGLGAIGKAVAQRAMAFEMEVIAWSRSLTPEKAEILGIGYCATMEELAKKADAVTLHLAVTPDTEHIIGENFLSKMKDNAMLINTSRGKIIDTRALTEAIDKRGLRVALDVYENEPGAGEKSFPLTDLAFRLYAGTHHIGASTNQASEAIASEVVKIVEHFKETGTPFNCVNIGDRTTEGYTLVVRHFNHVGILAGVLDELRNSNINIEEMQNTIFSGGEAAVCILLLDDKPDDKLLKKINQGEYIISAELK